MITRSRLLLGFFFLLAIALTFFKVPLASSQGVTIIAAEVTDSLPLADPESAQWEEATALEIPLSAQNVALPRPVEASVRSLTARALHNGEQIAILVEWDDETQNDQMVRVQDFRDAVAVQFPLLTTDPYFCMGQQGGNVNIWHWKADWQADLAARQDVDTAYTDMYVDYYPFAETEAGVLASVEDYADSNYLPAFAAGNLFALPDRHSSVEDIIAGGFGTLTTQALEGQNVQGYGVWDTGKWRVIFSRTLTSEETDDIRFSPGRVYSIAFAAWDGEFEERNGQKSTSQWVSLQLQRSVTPSQTAEAAPASETGYPLIFWILMGGVVLFVITCGIIYPKLPEN